MSTEATTYEETKKKLEAEQENRVLGTNNRINNNNVIDNIIKSGNKIEVIQDALKSADKLRLEVENERNKNLEAYLQERELRLLAQKEADNLRKQMEALDREKIEAIDQISRDRDANYTQSQSKRELEKLSQEKFNEMMNARKRG